MTLTLAEAYTLAAKIANEYYPPTQYVGGRTTSWKTRTDNKREELRQLIVKHLTTE